MSLYTHILFCEYIQGKFLAVEMLSERVCELFILLDIAQYLSKEVEPICTPIISGWRYLFPHIPVKCGYSQF